MKRGVAAVAVAVRRWWGASMSVRPTRRSRPSSIGGQRLVVVVVEVVGGGAGVRRAVTC